MKKNGFTLIELLAVIVILAIIALIATPIVLNIIKDSKASSTLRSANFYLSAVEQLIVKENDTKGILKNTKCDIKEDGNLTCDGYEKELKIEIKGEIPSSGKIAIKENKIEDIELYYEDKLIIKNKEKKLIYAEEIYEDVKDNNPGIICGKENKEDLAKEICYIKSIEDLVKLSTLVNSGTTFENKKVELTYNLDFNNKRSYASKKIDESLITGEGFKPIGYSTTRTFKGTFEGNNNTIKSLYINRPETSYVGLFGIAVEQTIQNLNLNEFNITGKSSVGSLTGCNSSGKILNVKVNDIYINSISNYAGGLSGTSYNEPAEIKNIELKNININGGSDIGGLIGTSKGRLVENIIIENINLNGTGNWIAGLIASNVSNVKNIQGNNITVIAKGRRGAGLVGQNQGTIFKVRLSNVNVSANDYVGGIAGSNEGSISFVKLDNAKVTGVGNYTGGLVGLNSGTFENSIFDGDVRGFYSTALGAGTSSGVIKNIVVEGIVESTRNAIGGIAGSTNATNSGELSTISGVFKSGSLIGVTPYRTVGLLKSATINTLASSQILVNGNPVVSDDPTSVNGKSLDDMGVTSKSEYEALGFEFESTDENEAYWYFNEDDELDLMIKKVD